MTDPTPTAEDRVPTFYVNNTRVRTNVYDVVLYLTQTVPDGLETGERTVPVCRVCMSPSHALSLLRMLEDHLKKYQSKHGKLPDPMGERFAQSGREEDRS